MTTTIIYEVAGTDSETGYQFEECITWAAATAQAQTMDRRGLEGIRITKLDGSEVISIWEYLEGELVKVFPEE